MNGNKTNKGQGFDKNPQNINRNGTPKKVSIKAELERILQTDGVVVYTGNQIAEQGVKNGIPFVKIKMPTQQALASKFVSIAMGGADRANTLGALKTIIEQFDGKAKQSLEVTEVPADRYDYSILSKKEKETLIELLNKCSITED